MTSPKRITGPTIALRSGAYFDFTKPELSEFSIRDIAHALGNICRFTGHTGRFYSVAEHSVHCSQIVEDGHQFAALMHDAAEAFVGDVAKPLKALLPDYAAIEERVEAAVLTRFGLPPKMPLPVKTADMTMLRIEQAQAMDNADAWADIADLSPHGVKLMFWPPEIATKRFLRRFEELGGHQHQLQSLTA